MKPQSSRTVPVRRRRVRVPLPGANGARGAGVRGATSEPARGAVRWAIALAHGAGGTMDQPLLVALADALAARGALVLRFNFPYADAGRKAPDRAPALVATAAAAARWLAARPRARGAKLVVGGKSMGGRMASLWLADRDAATPGVAGLLLVGYPLHPAGQPAKLRVEHLARVPCPQLYLEGTRDPLCDLALLRPALRKLRGRATLHVVAGGDHSFAVPKALGRSADDVVQELVGATVAWLEAL